jgi:hypothetical protein
VDIRAARLSFLLSVFLLSIVGLAFSTLASNENKTELENKQKFAQRSEKGEVLPGTSPSTYYYKFYLKDASVLGVVLPGNTEPDPSLITGATVVVLNQSSFTCGDSGSDYTFVESSGFYKLICQEAATMQVQISKTGYETKTTSLAYYQGEIPTIYLSKYVAPTPPPETIKDITLPKIFREKGAQTTDLSKIKNPAKVKNLTLDTKKSTIKFKGTVNLSAAATKNKFKKLHEYVKMNQTAVVGLNSGALKALNKKASVTMKELPWVSTPRVLVDGKEDKSVVSNIEFSEGTLTFDVKHFSTLKAAPSIKVIKPVDDFEVSEKQIKLKGIVSDSTASVSAKLNDKDLGKLKVATSSGEIEATLDLVEGYNELIIKALSANGTKASVVISGVFKESNLYLYIVIGILALVAVGTMVFSFVKLRKGKKSSSPQKPKTSDSAVSN